MDKNFPDEIFYKVLSVLLFNIASQVAVLAIFHYDVNLSVDDEGVEISYDEMTVKLSEEFCFYKGFNSVILLHFIGVHYFHNVTLVGKHTSNLFTLAARHVYAVVTPNIQLTP